MNTYDTLTQAITGLSENGYGYNFNVTTSGVYCKDLDLSLSANDFHVDAVYRFEGDTDPDNNEVLYAITSASGVKGLLVDGYGPSADALTADMVAKLKIDNHTAR